MGKSTRQGPLAWPAVGSTLNHTDLLSSFGTVIMDDVPALLPILVATCALSVEPDQSQTLPWRVATSQLHFNMEMLVVRRIYRPNRQTLHEMYDPGNTYFFLPWPSYPSFVFC